MKTVKKALHLLLALALVFVLAVPAFAMYSPTYAITLNNHSDAVSMNGTTYNAYKLFDVTSYDAVKQAYQYTVADAFSGFTYDDGTTTHTSADMVSYVYSLDGNDDGLKAFTQAVSDYITSNSIPVAGSAEGTEDDSVTIDLSSAGAGYYIVLASGKAVEDNTVTALCNLTTAAPTSDVNLKADAPTIDKQVQEDSTSTWGKVADYSIGEDVPFKISSTIPSYASTYDTYTYVIHDTMDPTLSYNDGSLAVYNGDTLVSPDSTTYTLTTGTDINQNTLITLDFASDYIKAHGGDSLTVTYTGKLTEDALIYNEYQDNTVYLEYSNNPYNTSSKANTPEHKVHVYTYQFDIYKYFTQSGSQTDLAGAYFKLYSDASCENEIRLVEDEAFYRPMVSSDTAESTAMVSGADGLITIKGLDEGVYYLKETQAPEGFNAMTDPIKVTISRTTNETSVTGMTLQKDTEEVNRIEIENSTGGLLPATGGIGTTIFYVVGGGLTAGAAILLITRRRMNGRK
ncbi:MAG: SpaH/EbpB family LPXTG-anchored major pilin [Intestinimonas sp.]|nr:SpaH/EbpB family LPXTG-anchored major pilin [Intestinimonas sp.]